MGSCLRFCTRFYVHCCPLRRQQEAVTAPASQLTSESTSLRRLRRKVDRSALPFSARCKMRLLIYTCLATLSAAVITPGADKLVDDALDGCDALLVEQLRTERDSAYRARDDAVAAKDAAEATAQRLAADEAAKAAQAARSECEAASAAALEKATAASASALAACEASSAAELAKATAASAATSSKPRTRTPRRRRTRMTTEHAAALKGGDRPE